jgi:glutaconate CoA-transferase, subunit A
MVQAGSMGLPFIAVRGLLHSDILTYRPDLLVRENPFNPGEQVVMARPIRPDVAAFHAVKADRWGNAVTPGHRDDLMMARAARRVVVTAEEIVDGELTPHDVGNDTFLPAIDVDIVTYTPLGAHPCGCGSLYEQDETHCQAYVEAAKGEASFRAYLECYVYGVRSHSEYLERVDATTRQARATDS